MLELNINKYKYKILVLMLICGILAYILSLFIPSEWKASTSILIGKNYLEKGSLEPINVVIQRLKQKTIHDNILIQTDINPRLQLKQAGLFYKSLIISQIKDSDAVEISLKANSQNLAKKQLQLLTSNIINEHQKINTNILVILKNKENLINNELQKLEENYKTQYNSSNDMLRLNLNQLYLNNKFNYYKELTQIQEVRQNINNYPTKLIAPVYIEDKKSFPNPIIFTLCGIVFGFILSYVYFYTKQYIEKI